MKYRSIPGCSTYDYDKISTSYPLNRPLEAEGREKSVNANSEILA